MKDKKNLDNDSVLRMIQLITIWAISLENLISNLSKAKWSRYKFILDMLKFANPFKYNFLHIG